MKPKRLFKLSLVMGAVMAMASTSSAFAQVGMALPLTQSLHFQYPQAAGGFMAVSTSGQNYILSQQSGTVNCGSGNSCFTQLLFNTAAGSEGSLTIGAPGNYTYCGGSQTATVTLPLNIVNGIISTKTGRYGMGPNCTLTVTAKNPSYNDGYYQFTVTHK